MTSHDFDAWNDANGDAPAAREPQPQGAAANTLKDIYALSTEDLPAHVAIARIQTIARAALEHLGVPVGDDEMIEPATGWFEDEPPDTAA
jgi:hypothetical protein